MRKIPGQAPERGDGSQIKNLFDSNSISDALVNRLKPMQRLSGGRLDYPAYYRSLLRHDDELVRTGAVCWLHDNDQYRKKAHSAAAKLGHYFCVRQRFDVSAGQVAEPDVPAAIAGDIDQFRQSGLPTALLDASFSAESAAGWRAGLEWSTRAMLLYGPNPQATTRTFKLLAAANQTAAIDALADFLADCGLFAEIVMLERAAVLARQAKYAEALDGLTALPPAAISSPQRPRLYALQAECLAGLGKFEEATRYYELQNTEGKSAEPHLMARFPDQIRALNDLSFGRLPSDTHDNHVMMVGFPRSGTTLLEAALAAHPDIETYEEIPAFSGMANHFMAQAGRSGTSSSVDANALRDAYYRDLKTTAANSGALVHVDKMPIRSIYGPFLRQLFPEKRYIFSLRHPFDVVLSCFRTTFGTNMGMIHFDRFADACALYDLAMVNWFDAFPLTGMGLDANPDIGEARNNTICTVRYERLVTDFEAEMARVLTFLGVPWNDAVTQFAEASEQRRAQTPSYRKVRQGLGLGVQTHWRDYQFLFTGPEASKLHRWVERFGYEGL